MSSELTLFKCVFCAKKYPDHPELWADGRFLVNGTAKCLEHLKTRSWQAIKPMPATTGPVPEIDPTMPLPEDDEDKDKPDKE